jgi:hypothetical protein
MRVHVQMCRCGCVSCISASAGVHKRRCRCRCVITCKCERKYKCNFAGVACSLADDLDLCMTIIAELVCSSGRYRLILPSCRACVLLSRVRNGQPIRYIVVLRWCLTCSYVVSHGQEPRCRAVRLATYLTQALTLPPTPLRIPFQFTSRIIPCRMYPAASSSCSRPPCPSPFSRVV